MDSSAAIAGPNLLATIHIGASAVSMLILEGDPEDSPTPVEFLEQPLPLARDIFRRGRISRSTTERTVEILHGYRESLREVGAGSDGIVRAVATNILSEADNAEVFLNRLSIACGLHLEILDDGEMTRLIYLKTRRRLRDTPSMKKRTTLVVHVGPGNTRVLLFRKGRIDRYSSYRLGTHRTSETVESTHAEGEALLRVIREHILGQITQMFFDFENDEIEDLVVIGYEIQLLAPLLTNGARTRVSLKALRPFVAEAAGLTEEERVRQYQLDYHTSDAVIPSLETNHAIAERFGMKAIRIPDSDFERGLLMDLAISSPVSAEFRNEVIRSTRILSQKFKVDAQHASHVALLARRLFEETQELHQLDSHDAMLLEVAAILHECGGYISPKAHHKHSHYLIQNSEVFGLGLTDVQVVALVARYHRRSGPSTRHSGYRDLSAANRIRVAKLAALLRVADALERAHSQRVRDFSTEVVKDRLRLTLQGVSDAAVERLAMQGKGDVFNDIFGLEVVLVEQG